MLNSSCVRNAFAFAGSKEIATQRKKRAENLVI